MGYKILDERETFEACKAKMLPEDRTRYLELKDNRYEQVFIERIFYIYKCMGRDSKNNQRPPEILAKFRVINFAHTLDQGFLVSLLNETTNKKQVLNAVPAKLFGFDVFGSMPVSTKLRFNQLIHDDGRSHFDTTVGIYIKATNKADFYSNKCTYVETPNRMAALYPGRDWGEDRN